MQLFKSNKTFTFHHIKFHFINNFPVIFIFTDMVIFTIKTLCYFIIYCS